MNGLPISPVGPVTATVRLRRGRPAATVLRAAHVLVARLAGQQDARRLARHDDPRLHGHDLAAAGVLEQRVGGGERRELLEVLDRREDEQDLAALVGVERALRREPAEVDALRAVDRGLRAVGRGREEEVRVEADLHLGRGDPARELHERRRVDARDAPPPRRSSRTAAARCASSPSPSSASTAPPGKTHDAAHEARRRGCAGRAAARAPRRRRAGGSPTRPAAGPSPRRCSAPRRARAVDLHRAAAYLCAAMSTDDRPTQQLDLRVLRIHLRPGRGRPRRRHPARDGVRGHPRHLVLSRVRRAQARLRALRGLRRASTRRTALAPRRRRGAGPSGRRCSSGAGRGSGPRRAAR